MASAPQECESFAFDGNFARLRGSFSSAASLRRRSNRWTNDRRCEMTVRVAIVGTGYVGLVVLIVLATTYATALPLSTAPMLSNH
jgi:hypothetical protein